MDNSFFAERIVSLLRQYYLPMLLSVAGVICLGYGLYQLSVPTKEEIVFEKGTESEDTKKTITIDVQGAVNKPGVYMLSEDARMQDALLQAGGLSEDADRKLIAQTVNLASKLTDGTKIYVPFVGEQSVIGSAEGGGSLINLNTASQKELEALPGIGPVTAEKVIASRPYGSFEDVVIKKGLSQTVLDKIRDQVTVY